MSKRNSKKREFMKALQKHIPIREKHLEYERQLMKEIEKDLETVKDLRKQISLITDPMERRVKIDLARYLLEICKEKLQRSRKQSEIFGLIDITFGIN